MNTKLITALRTAATSIENGTFTYSWTDPTRCNCGVLACSLLGLAPRKLNERIQDMPKQTGIGMTWTHFAATVCPITGIPEHALFKTLFSHGLTQADFHHLEYLTDERIRSRMQMPSSPKPQTFTQWLFDQPSDTEHETIDYKNGAHVALYMRAWARLLEEQGREDDVDIRMESGAITRC